jgi:hypothetical protein
MGHQLLLPAHAVIEGAHHTTNGADMEAVLPPPANTQRSYHRPPAHYLEPPAKRRHFDNG